MPKKYDRSTSLIQARPGETFTIELPAVPTAGFQWKVRATAEKVVSQESDEFVPARSGIGGAAGQRFAFRAVGKGHTSLVFVYARPWEETGREEIKVEVKVD